MIDIGYLYEQFNSVYNTRQAGFFRPVRDFVPAVHDVSLQIFNTLGRRQQKNQFTTDMLSPFMKGMNISVVKDRTMDYAPTPPDYIYYASSSILMENDRIGGKQECDVLKNGACIKYKDVDPGFFVDETEYVSIKVTLIQNGKWDDVATHPTRHPKMGASQKDSRIYCTQRTVSDKTVFEILPKNIGVIVLYYYRIPNSPVYAYKEVKDGPDVHLEYVKEQSKQLEWSEAMIPVFLYKLGKRYGLGIQDQLTIQVSEMDKELMQ